MPNEDVLDAKDFSKLMKIIDVGFSKFVSLEFEHLCEKLILNNFGQSSNFGSFWTKNTEIDLLLVTQKGESIAGEAKWKNHKVCKNTLTLLERKCKHEKLHIDKFALFSKSGFSKELKSLQNERILLFDLEDIKKMYM